jgi:DNA-binding protein YbaB
MDNDAARHELTDALALLREHMADLAILEQKRAALSATATVAEGTVAVTVNARGVVSSTVVDESYFNEHDLADLGDYVTAAVQEAARAVEMSSAELLAPLAERRARFPSLSDVVAGAPDIRALLAEIHPIAKTQPTADEHEDEANSYPTVRSSQ